MVINPLFQQVFKLENGDLMPMNYLSEPFYGYNIVRGSHSPAKLVELLTAGSLAESIKKHENIYAFCPREFYSWD